MKLPPKPSRGAVLITVPASGPDYGQSVPFRFDRALAKEWRLLGDWMTGQVFRFYKLGIPRSATMSQISAAVDCILANLIDAHQISPKYFLAISRRGQTYTKSRYVDVEFGYINFIRVLDFLTKAEPPFATFKIGFFDRRANKAIGFVSRYAASEPLVRLIKGYPQAIKKFSNENSFSMDDVIKDAFAYTKSNPLSAAGKVTLPTSLTIFRTASDIIRVKDSNDKLVDYEDTNLTIEMRARLQRWNEFITEHHHVDLLVSDEEMENVFANNSDESDEEAFLPMSKSRATSS